MNCISSCSYTPSLQNRSSPHGSHLFAHISFVGNIEFRRGSKVKVFGKYALSITSQNGSISIHTDVNMTCGEEVLDTTCLGGFTHNSTAQEDASGEKIYEGKNDYLMPLYIYFLNILLARTKCKYDIPHLSQPPLNEGRKASQH